MSRRSWRLYHRSVDLCVCVCGGSARPHEHQESKEIRGLQLPMRRKGNAQKTRHRPGSWDRGFHLRSSLAGAEGHPRGLAGLWGAPALLSGAAALVKTESKENSGGGHRFLLCRPRKARTGHSHLGLVGIHNSEWGCKGSVLRVVSLAPGGLALITCEVTLLELRGAVRGCTPGTRWRRGLCLQLVQLGLRGCSLEAFLYGDITLKWGIRSRHVAVKTGRLNKLACNTGHHMPPEVPERQSCPQGSA